MPPASLYARLLSLGSMAQWPTMSSEGRLSPMSSNFTQAQREFLSNVKQTIALIDKEIQRIREQRIAICMSGFELDWQLLCIGTTQSANGANKLGSMINAHTDFQAALRELLGAQSPALASPELLPKPVVNGSDAPSLRLETNAPARSPGSGRYSSASTDAPATAAPVASPSAN